MNDQQGTVFLIDDDAGVRDALTLLLSLKGMSTQPFATADTFIQASRIEPIIWRGFAHPPGTDGEVRGRPAVPGA